jgi:hypothetical protein
MYRDAVSSPPFFADVRLGDVLVSECIATLFPVSCVPVTGENSGQSKVLAC